ncbi:MAG: UDP-N-acetylmuramoyl-tripeptide--D-alanyl-D-alanine ligase [Chlorobium sp.]|uniref:UDP-N-acetylmuramoyl-tripeptide--D-alanyl-D- alanine ligase n=1 Tax=Chlorobium sp. TaxID=1095 RepID=UPI0025BF30C3|nr:UDP-N-acetylmuramoyl-tripeptide--D-alanyl-D-alanine ligase [Chlorobium sp.]MCF8382201.1 UDP-N-acetylmuramoyl-tripeptide--D-alanyl-D-alanine ligase [Chlorobium sp.]
MKGVIGIDDLRRIGRVVTEGTQNQPNRIIEPRVVIDSRQVKGGEIFVALRGERTDGHRYVDEVFARGASWAVVSEEWLASRPSGSGTAERRYLVVSDTTSGLQQMAAAYRRTFPIPLFAVGGSNGKTTTKELIGSVLGTGFRVHMSRGNLNNHLGVPLTLLQMQCDTEMAVVEMGINHPGEMELLASIAMPTHGLLTNIGHEHLEFLNDLAGVAAAETKLYDYLDLHGGTCFINTDDPWLKRSAAGLTRAVLYGLKESGESIPHVRDVTLDAFGRASFRLFSGTDFENIALKLTGRHNVINALAAAAVGRYFGLSLGSIKEGLEKLQPASGWKRMEFQEAGGVMIVNDTYNANPDSVRLALDLLGELQCTGRKIAVLGDMLELGASAELEHEKTGRYIQQSAIDMLFTFGNLSRLFGGENRSRLCGHFENRDELYRALAGVVASGDAVLFKGSRGMRLEEVADALCRDRASQSTKL